MRRSTLQRKDRDELTQIATTLGKKPSSRARKGEIIDFILDLAAGGDGGGNAEESTPRHRCPDATVSPDTGDASDDTDSDDDQPANDSGDASVDADNRPEPGNRRRRRRGRDRDNRNDGSEQGGDPIPAEGGSTSAARATASCG